MKNGYSHIVGILDVERRQQGRKLDPGRRHPGFKLVEHLAIQARLAIAVEQPQARQQAAQKLLLGNDVERPGVLGGELLCHGQLAPDLRPRELL